MISRRVFIFIVRKMIKGWRHIGGVQRSSGDGNPQKLRGWVGEQYLKYVDYSTCDDIAGR
jgi:hypothetical protein